MLSSRAGLHDMSCREGCAWIELRSSLNHWDRINSDGNSGLPVCFKTSFWQICKYLEALIPSA